MMNLTNTYRHKAATKAPKTCKTSIIASKNKTRLLWILLCLMPMGACQDLLSPQPVDRISDDLVIKDASSARVALTSVYRSFVALTAPKIVAGDLMADNLIHNGTFIQYLEISNKDLSASNASAEALWSVVYQVAYRANFVLEWLERIEITQNQFDENQRYRPFLAGLCILCWRNHLWWHPNRYQHRHLSQPQPWPCHRR
jgi:hypothetical protein